MSRNGRIGLIVAALLVAVVGFVVASPGEDDESRGETNRSAPATEAAPAEATPAETTEEPAPPPEPEVTRIRIRAGQAVGGPQQITAENGDVVRIVIQSDQPDELHLHGYDVTRSAAPGQPARFRVEANIEGSFELESHVAEDAGANPLVARLNVEPG